MYFQTILFTSFISISFISINSKRVWLRFICENTTLQPYNIGKHKVCDGVADCANQLDELSCSNDTHFYCESGLDKFISKSRVYLEYIHNGICIL